MNLRPWHTRSNRNELSKVTKNTKTSTTNASKLKRIKKTETSDSLPDRQPMDEIHKKLRPFRVKVKRLNWKTPNRSDEAEKTNASSNPISHDSRSRASQSKQDERSKCAPTTEMDAAEPQAAKSASTSLHTSSTSNNENQPQLQCRKTRQSYVKILRSTSVRSSNESNNVQKMNDTNKRHKSLGSKHTEENTIELTTKDDSGIKELHDSRSQANKSKQDERSKCASTTEMEEESDAAEPQAPKSASTSLHTSSTSNKENQPQLQCRKTRQSYVKIVRSTSARSSNESNTLEIAKFVAPVQKMNDTNKCHKSLGSKHTEENTIDLTTEDDSGIKEFQCSKSQEQRSTLNDYLKLKSNRIEDLPVKAQIECDKTRRCCVKIPRLKSSVRTAMENVSNKTQDSCQYYRNETNVSSNDALYERNIDNSEAVVSQTNILKSSNSKSLSSFRNPALALTYRRALEIGLKKSSTTDDTEMRLANKHPTPPKLNRSITMHASPFSDMLSDKEIDFPKDNQEMAHTPLISHTKTIIFEEKNMNTEKSSKQQKRAQNNTSNQKNSIKSVPKARGKLTKKLSYQKDSSKNQDVYEFLSQTSDSESDKHKDPAADIIKNLIKKGKVVVTRNRKGKPIVIPRKRNRRAVIKQCPQTKPKNVTKPLKKQAFQPIHDIPEEDEQDRFDVHFDIPIENDDVLPFVRPDVPKESNESDTTTSNNVNSPNTQSAFSSLARTVLLRQTNKNKSTRQINFDREIQKWVSTPQRRPQISFAEDNVNLSPILRTTNDNTLENAIENNNVENAASLRPNFSEVGPNISLSFSSNDSNAENMPPPALAKETALESKDENASIFNTRQTLNPRRTCINRSPLKTINIIEVITLPPYKEPFNKDIEGNDTLKKNQKTRNRSVKKSEHEKSNKSAEKSVALFGFEEYLNDDATEIEEESNNNRTSSSSATLRSQLKKLKNWCPKPRRYETAKCSTITRHIFDDDFVKKRGQVDIRNMLCSTMIDATSKKTENTTTHSLLNNSDSDSSENIPTTSKGNVGLDLFGDPESTFNQENLHRTYERPFKRKRKLQHQYSVFFDSEDESENEDVLDTSFNKKAKRQVNKRNEREKSPNPELDKFVSEFNSMIKEAEDYELVVN